MFASQSSIIMRQIEQIHKQMDELRLKIDMLHGQLPGLQQQLARARADEKQKPKFSGGLNTAIVKSGKFNR